MNNNVLYAVLGAIVVVSAIIGYLYYEDQREASGIDISVGKGGISIEKKYRRIVCGCVGRLPEALYQRA